MSGRLAKGMQKLVLGSLIGRIDAWEDRVAALPEAHREVADSPLRVEILRGKLEHEGGVLGANL